MHIFVEKANLFKIKDQWCAFLILSETRLVSECHFMSHCPKITHTKNTLKWKVLKMADIILETWMKWTYWRCKGLTLSLKFTQSAHLWYNENTAHQGEGTPSKLVVFSTNTLLWFQPGQHVYTVVFCQTSIVSTILSEICSIILWE